MRKELQDFGLSEKESNVYVAALELAQATVQQISQKSKVNRATTYVQLESLKERGLVSQVTKDKKTYFVAERPEKVLKLLEREKAEILFKETEFNKILPSLKAIYNASKDRPNVRFYEGHEAVILYREEIMKEKHAYFYAIDRIIESDEAFNPEVLAGFTKRVEDFRYIYVCEKEIAEFQDLSKTFKNLSIKYLDAAKLPSDLEIVIFGNKLWINNKKGKPLAVVIEDKIIAASFKAMYDIFWQLAK